MNTETKVTTGVVVSTHDNELPTPTEFYYHSNGDKEPIRVKGYTREQVIAAIKAARLACRELDFWGRDNPRCPHCGYDYDIQDHEAWQLYEEGEHEIECPSCDLEYTVTVSVSYSYSTDEQEDDAEGGGK